LYFCSSHPARCRPDRRDKPPEPAQSHQPFQSCSGAWRGNQPIPSLIDGLRSAREWDTVRRQQIAAPLDHDSGKLRPNDQDRQWFGDIRQAVIRDTTDHGSYTRTALDLPIEKDFLQHHVLLTPKARARFRR
jgi:hypothetical protein